MPIRGLAYALIFAIPVWTVLAMTTWMIWTVIR